MKKALAVASAASILFLTACGGDGRPSVDELADGLQSMADELGAMPEGVELGDDFYNCWAENIHGDEEISDDSVRALAEGDTDYEGSTEEGQAVQAAVLDCMEFVTP